MPLGLFYLRSFHFDQWPPFRSKVAQIQEGQGVQLMPSGMERWAMERCLTFRMGGRMAVQSGEGALESTRLGGGHECARASCDIFGTPEIHAISEE